MYSKLGLSPAANTTSTCHSSPPTFAMVTPVAQEPSSAAEPMTQASPAVSEPLMHIVKRTVTSTGRTSTMS